MKAKLRLDNREVIIDDVKKAEGFGKFRGLMFRGKETNALLFEFKKGRRAIHSLFCKLFLAVWLLDGKIVNCKLVKPFRLAVKCDKEFDKLLEVPLSNKYSTVIGEFLSMGNV